MLLPRGDYGSPDQRWIAQTKAIQGAAASTARIIISAEEKLRQRVRLFLRVALATIFLGISGLISLGANVTTAFAKKVSSDRGSHGLRVKQAATHLKTKPHYRHSARIRHQKMALATAQSHHGLHHQMRGVASWYGKQFHNRKTASGVRFNTHAMMAAHKTLPFGTKVRVTNLANQKSCVVKIMDRGPYAKGRIIDLSLAAAEKLDMTQRGVADVKLEILGGPQPTMFEDIAESKEMPVFDRIPRHAFRLPTLNTPVLADEDGDQ